MKKATKNNLNQNNNLLQIASEQWVSLLIDHLNLKKDKDKKKIMSIKYDQK